MRLPEVRSTLILLSEDQRLPKDIAKHLRGLAAEITRRPSRRMAQATSAPSTPALRKQIREYARENPTMSQLEIGKRFNVNQGRVSEALRGFRH